MNDYLTVGQAARILGVDPKTVVRYVKKGQITGTYRSNGTPTGHVRIPRAEIERIMSGVVTPQP